MTSAVDKATAELAEARAARDGSRRKLDEAVKHREATRRRVADGDDDVTGADLTDADQAVELANLRTEAADKRADRAEHALHAAEIDQLRNDITALRDGPGRTEMGEALEHADDALRQLAAVCESHQLEVRDLARRASTLKPLPDDLHLDAHGLRMGRFDLVAPKLHDLLDALFSAWKAGRASAPPPLKGPIRTYATPTLLERYDKATA